MNTFSVFIMDATHSERFEGIRSFVAEDASGGFGILPNHARLMTSLITGLSRMQSADGEWLYIAMAGGLLYFRDNRLQLVTRHFVIDRDYASISSVLTEQMLDEENRLKSQKQSLRRVEEEVLKRIWEMARGGPHSYAEV